MPYMKSIINCHHYCYLHYCVVFLEGVQVCVPGLARPKLPEYSPFLNLTSLALTIFVLPPEVVGAIGDGELLTRLNVSESLQADQLPREADKL